MKFSISKILQDSKEWNKADVLDINSQIDKVDSDQSWSQLMIRYKRKKQLVMYRYAAVISLLAMSVLAFYLLNFGGDEMIYVEANLETKEYLLPDSSTIWLRNGTTISYSNKYGVENRNLTIKGTAFFEVQKNKALPFIIKSDKSAIEVLGTSFLYDAAKLNNVQVFTGVVKFSNQNGAFRVLRKGEGIILNEKNEFIKTAFDPNLISWKTKRLVFENVAINEVMKVLSDYYGVLLEAKNADDVKVTASFDENTLKEVIEYIQIATGVEIRLKEN